MEKTFFGKSAAECEYAANFTDVETWFQQLKTNTANFINKRNFIKSNGIMYKGNKQDHCQGTDSCSITECKSDLSICYLEYKHRQTRKSSTAECDNLND